MRKQFELVRTLWIVVIVLSVLQGVLTIIEPDIKHIILSCVVGVGLLLLTAMFIYLLFEVKQLFFETTKEDYMIRLVTEDDFQIIRTLCSSTPLTNSKEEVSLLEEYEKITVDYVRMHYHYLVYIKEEAVGLLYAKKVGKKELDVILKTELEENESLQKILLTLAQEHNYKIKLQVEKLKKEQEA